MVSSMCISVDFHFISELSSEGGSVCLVCLLGAFPFPVFFFILADKGAGTVVIGPDALA